MTSAGTRVLALAAHVADPSPAAPVELPAPLLTAREVGRLLGTPHKRVYELPIARVRISAHAFRWKLEDVVAFIESRREVA